MLVFALSYRERPSKRKEPLRYITTRFSRSVQSPRNPQASVTPVTAGRLLPQLTSTSVSPRFLRAELRDQVTPCMGEGALLCSRSYCRFSGRAWPCAPRRPLIQAQGRPASLGVHPPGWDPNLLIPGRPHTPQVPAPRPAARQPSARSRVWQELSFLERSPALSEVQQMAAMQLPPSPLLFRSNNRSAASLRETASPFWSGSACGRAASATLLASACFFSCTRGANSG